MGTATRGAPLLLAVLGTVDPTTAFGHGSVAEPEAFDDDDTSRSMYGRAAAYGGVDARSFDQAPYLGRSETYEEEGYDYDVDYALYGRHKHDYSYDAAPHLENSSGTYDEYEYDYWVLPHDLKVELEATRTGRDDWVRDREGGGHDVWKHGVDAGVSRLLSLTLGQFMLQVADTEYESREQTATDARLESVASHIASIETRLNAMESHLGVTSERMDAIVHAIEMRIESMALRIDGLDQQAAKLKYEVAAHALGLGNVVRDVYTESRERRSLEARFDAMSSRFGATPERLDALEYAMADVVVANP